MYEIEKQFDYFELTQDFSNSDQKLQLNDLREKFNLMRAKSTSLKVEEYESFSKGLLSILKNLIQLEKQRKNFKSKTMFKLNKTCSVVVNFTNLICDIIYSTDFIEKCDKNDLELLTRILDLLIPLSQLVNAFDGSDWISEE